MSAYIYCPSCREDSLDVDTLSCECGYSPHEEAATLRVQLAAAQAENERLREAAQLMVRYFESGNGVPVYRATILGNCEAVIQLRAALAKEPPR